MKYWFLVFFILNAVLIKAQSSSDSVRMVVHKLFDAMRNADAEQLKQCFTDSAILQTVVTSPAGGVNLRNEKVKDFTSFLSHTAKGDADERIEKEIVHIDGALASVWAPYSFYYKGKFSHCGVNSFQLVRFFSGWKIQYLIDTRRKEGCDKR